MKIYLLKAALDWLSFTFLKRARDVPTQELLEKLKSINQLTKHLNCSLATAVDQVDQNQQQLYQTLVVTNGCYHLSCCIAQPLSKWI